jgi:lipopolysaccharide biosynthesis regulator YciM
MWGQSVELFGLGVRITLSQLLVLVAFAALVLGYFLAWLVNRRQKAPSVASSDRADRMVSNQAFMRGINFILSDQTDKAIEELTQAVSVDTETVETYVALGNLFRRNGEIERAIRIRQSIIIRPNLDTKVRNQALYDLGLDYRRGGFLERAVNAFEEVLQVDPKRLDALRELALLYEETRDWDKAAQIQERVARITGSRPVNVLAHYQVELGKDMADRGLHPQARSAFKKAVNLDPSCVDAYLHLGDLHVSDGKAKKALGVWRKLIEVAPDQVHLTFDRLIRVAAEMKDLKPVEAFLNDCVAVDHNPLPHVALARLLADRGQTDRAAEELNKALGLEPGLIEAHRQLGLLLLTSDRTDDAIQAYRDLLANLTPIPSAFQCELCGFESHELMWRCPQCAAWDTMNLKPAEQAPRVGEVAKPYEEPTVSPPPVVEEALGEDVP